MKYYEKIKRCRTSQFILCLRIFIRRINYAQNQIIQLKLDISKEIKHDKDLNVTAFNPYVNEWKAELKTYRKRIHNDIKKIKQLKSEIKKNQRFMNDILN